MSKSLFQLEKSLVIPPGSEKLNDPEWLKQYLANYWLNLGDTSEIHTVNPFSLRTEYDMENPHVFLLDLMRRPEYFGFTAKHIFNKTLPPFQQVILQEMWKRPFPMLIGSRGMGKCIRGDSLVMTGGRICRIEELVGDAPEMERVQNPGCVAFGENGFKEVAYAWNNGWGSTKKATTRSGYVLEGTLNHPIRVVSGKEIVWRDLADVRVGDRIVIDRTESWFEPKSNLTEDEAYLCGLLVGDVGYTKKGNIGFTTADQELAEEVSRLAMAVWGKPFKKQKGQYQYLLCGKGIYDSLFQRFGFNSSVCGEKDFPSSVLNASKEAMAAFIRGLMDTDGTVTQQTKSVQFAAKSERIVRTLQFVLTRFGIASTFRSKLNKKYNRYYHYLNISGPSLRVYAKSIGFGLRRKKEALARVIESPVNANLDVIPKSFVLDDLLSLRERWADVRPTLGRGYFYSRGIMSPYRLKTYDCTYEHLGQILTETESLSYTAEWQRLNDILEKHYYFDTVKAVEDGACRTYDVHIPEDHSFISNGFVSHNSWILGFYSMLKCLFNQGTKIVICGAAFRQAKVVFDYCADIWEKSPVLRDIVGPGKHNGPRRDVDRCSLRMGDSIITALPIGDGCLSPSAMVTYGDSFGVISEGHREVFENSQTRIVSRTRDVWGSKSFRESDEAYYNGFVDTKKVKTRSGREIEGTPNHKLKVLRGLEIEWVRLDEMLPGDKLLVDRSQRWHSGKEVFTNDEAYRVGLKAVQNGGLCARILAAPRRAMSACVRGIFDALGQSFDLNGRTVAIECRSERLVSQLQYILLHYGIDSVKAGGRLSIFGENAELFHEQIVLGRDCRAITAVLYDEIVDITESRSHTYDIHVPDGHEYCANGFFSHNTKIRGQRASIVIADEFASVPVAIFETVIRGFGAVSKDPVIKLIQEARIDGMKSIGIWSGVEDAEDELVMGNQTIISGTAYYAFNHFYSYWKRYKGIVDSMGDPRKLEEAFQGKIPEDFNWKDYSVIRIPASRLPKGFMDKRQLAQAKATVHSGTYSMEYQAEFISDSNGFFKRSLIESCVVGRPNDPIVREQGEVRFHCITKGDPKLRYVMAIDPASEKDNLSITILELHNDHRRIVYQWTTTRARYKAKFKKGIAKEGDYYRYACRKIRDLMKLFNIERIAVDSQGGGVAIIEGLQDKEKLEPGESPIYPVVVEGEEKETDYLAGEHTLEVINFAKAEWVRDANHGMRKDFEDKVLLFPEFNSALLGMAIEEDKLSGRIDVEKIQDEIADSKYRGEEQVGSLYDTLEDSIMEIEELKDELATIVHSQTGASLRDRWDTPETKGEGGKKGRLRKDRYSSLLMANMVARTMQRTPKQEPYVAYGGFATKLASKKSGVAYAGPEWWRIDVDTYPVVNRRR